MRHNIFNGSGIEQKRRDLQLLQTIEYIDSQKGLRRNDEFRPKRNNGFQIRLGVADLRFVRRGRRVVAKFRDADDFLIQADGKQDFRDARSQRDDAFRGFGKIEFPAKVINERPRGHVGHKGHPRENSLLATFHGVGRVGEPERRVTGRNNQQRDRQEHGTNASAPVPFFYTTVIPDVRRV